MDKFIAWLKQQSTWKGLTALGALLGVTITPEYQAQVIAIATMIYGALALFKDKD